jgi:hypothetical protein
MQLENSDQRRALAGKILQVEQLETAKALGAQRGLDFLAVTDGRQGARSPHKVEVLIKHAFMANEG